MKTAFLKYVLDNPSVLQFMCKVQLETLESFSQDTFSMIMKAFGDLSEANIKLSKFISSLMLSLIGIVITHYNSASETSQTATIYLQYAKLLELIFQYDKALEYHMKALNI